MASNVSYEVGVLVWQIALSSQNFRGCYDSVNGCYGLHCKMRRCLLVLSGEFNRDCNARCQEDNNTFMCLLAIRRDVLHGPPSTSRYLCTSPRDLTSAVVYAGSCLLPP